MINDDAAGKTDQVTSRFASIEAHTIFIDRIRMHRVGHADFEVTNLLRAAFECEHKMPFERGYLKRLKRMRSSNNTYKRLRENIWHFHLQLRIERLTGTLNV